MTSDKPSIPHITLDSRGRIIDIMTEAAPCLNLSSVKTLLIRRLSEGDREMLRNICSSGIGTAFFDIRIKSYRKCFAIGRKSGDDTFCELYLLTENEENVFTSIPYTKLFSQRTLDIFAAFDKKLTSSIAPEVAAELISPKHTAASLTDIAAITEVIVSRLSKQPESLSSRIKIESNEESHRPIHAEIVPFALLLTLLLSVLDTASSDGEIRLRTDRYADSYEVIMETRSVAPFGGILSTDILSLSLSIPGSYTRLSLAAYVSAKFGIRITAKRDSSDGILTISFGKIRDFLPPTEFKYKENAFLTDSVVDSALFLLHIAVTQLEE